MDNSDYIKVRNELIQAAKHKRTSDYLTVSYVLGFDRENREAANEALYGASKIEASDGKPILWPLVVEPESGLPNEKYFELLEKLGIEVKNKKDYFESGLEEVLSYWSKRRKTGNSSRRRR